MDRPALALALLAALAAPARGGLLDLFRWEPPRAIPWSDHARVSSAGDLAEYVMDPGRRDCWPSYGAAVRHAAWMRQCERMIVLLTQEGRTDSPEMRKWARNARALWEADPCGMDPGADHTEIDNAMTRTPEDLGAVDGLHALLAAEFSSGDLRALRLGLVRRVAARIERSVEDLAEGVAEAHRAAGERLAAAAEDVKANATALVAAQTLGIAARLDAAALEINANAAGNFARLGDAIDASAAQAASHAEALAAGIAAAVLDITANATAQFGAAAEGLAAAAADITGHASAQSRAVRDHVDEQARQVREHAERVLWDTFDGLARSLARRLLLALALVAGAAPAASLAARRNDLISFIFSAKIASSRSNSSLASASLVSLVATSSSFYASCSFRSLSCRRL